MSLSPGCQPSPLIETIFYRLPYFTSGLATNVSIETVLDDLVRAAGWAAILFGIVVVLSVCTCFYCCCTSFLCCVRGREKPLALKLLLGVVTGAIIVVGIIIMFVSFWAESALHNGIAGQVTEILSVINNVSDLNQDVYEVMNQVIQVDGTRHTLFITYFVIMLFFLLAVLTVVALAPVCKSGIGVIIVVIIVGVFTVVNGILVASVFAVIVVYTNVCVRLFSYNIFFSICDGAGGIIDASASIFVWLDYLDVFCNKSVNYGFTLFILSAILVVLFILIQIFGIAYGASFFGSKRESVAMNIRAMEDSGTDMTLYAGQSYASKDDIPLTNVVAYQ